MQTASRVRDSHATRNVILEAAELLFAERGFAGTSMRDLAVASGISQPLIHHYFGSKEILYTEVKQRVMERYVPYLQTESGKVSGTASIASDLTGLYHFLDQNRTLLRLSAWTRLEGDNTPWPREREMMQAVCDRIRRDQAAGRLRSDINPLNLAIMLIAVVYYWLEYRDYYQSVFDDQSMDDDEYLRQAVSLFSQGLTPQTPGNNKSIKDPISYPARPCIDR